MAASLSAYCAAAAPAAAATARFPALGGDAAADKPPTPPAAESAPPDCGGTEQAEDVPAADWAAAGAFPGPAWLRLAHEQAVDGRADDADEDDAGLTAEYLRHRVGSPLPNLATLGGGGGDLAAVYEAIARRAVAAAAATSQAGATSAVAAAAPAWAAAVHAHAALLVARAADQSGGAQSGGAQSGGAQSGGAQSGGATADTEARTVLSALCRLHALVGLRQMASGASGAGAHWASVGGRGRLGDAAAVDGRLAVHAVGALTAASRHHEPVRL